LKGRKINVPRLKGKGKVAFARGGKGETKGGQNGEGKRTRLGRMEGGGFP